MSASFDISIPTILTNEGGYANNPVDPGGETNYGISKRAYPNLDIRNLTVDDAKQIYLNDYWRFGDIISQNVATKCLDVIVNMGGPHGQGSGFKLIQQALMDLGAGIVPDGIWGQNTLKAINRFTESECLQEIRVHQTTYYTALVAQRPSDMVFYKDWLRRVQSC
jgi:lysozyme family protein